MKDFTVSGNIASFIPEKQFWALYFPFVSDRMKLHIDPETRTNYLFFVFHTPFGFKEMQEIFEWDIRDVTTQAHLEESFQHKTKDSLFFEKDERGNKIITIDRTKSLVNNYEMNINSDWQIPLLNYKGEAKGIVMLLRGADIHHKITIIKEDL